MRTEQITLAGKEYEIAELPIRKNAAWRQQLEETLAPMAELMQESQTINFEANNAGSIFGIVRQAGEMLVKSPDTITDLVFAYAPDVEADADTIRDEAYDSEVMDAFTAILRLAFPFGRLLGTVRALGVNGASGPAIKTTSAN
jgi:hypothetical protein